MKLLFFNRRIRTYDISTLILIMLLLGSSFSCTKKLRLNSKEITYAPSGLQLNLSAVHTETGFLFGFDKLYEKNEYKINLFLKDKENQPITEDFAKHLRVTYKVQGEELNNEHTRFVDFNNIKLESRGDVFWFLLDKNFLKTQFGTTGSYVLNVQIYYNYEQNNIGLKYRPEKPEDDENNNVLVATISQPISVIPTPEAEIHMTWERYAPYSSLQLQDKDWKRLGYTIYIFSADRKDEFDIMAKLQKVSTKEELITPLGNEGKKGLLEDKGHTVTFMTKITDLTNHQPIEPTPIQWRSYNGKTIIPQQTYPLMIDFSSSSNFLKDAGYYNIQYVIKRKKDSKEFVSNIYPLEVVDDRINFKIFNIDCNKDTIINDKHNCTEGGETNDGTIRTIRSNTIEWQDLKKYPDAKKYSLVFNNQNPDSYKNYQIKVDITETEEGKDMIYIWLPIVTNGIRTYQKITTGQYYDFLTATKGTSEASFPIYITSKLHIEDESLNPEKNRIRIKISIKDKATEFEVSKFAGTIYRIYTPIVFDGIYNTIRFETKSTWFTNDWSKVNDLATKLYLSVKKPGSNKTLQASFNNYTIIDPSNKKIPSILLLPHKVPHDYVYDILPSAQWIGERKTRRDVIKKHRFFDRRREWEKNKGRHVFVKCQDYNTATIISPEPTTYTLKTSIIIDGDQGTTIYSQASVERLKIDDRRYEKYLEWGYSPHQEYHRFLGRTNGRAVNEIANRGGDGGNGTCYNPF